MKKNQKEELQSRREFFKKAAKGALPILGAIVMTGTPVFVKAAEESPMGCRYGCSATCYGSCKNACDSCKYTCSGTCKNACLGCKYTCDGTCKNTCEGTCSHSSR